MIKTTKKISQVRETVKNWRKEGKTIGLVTTMGYLHEGHGSLIERASKENDFVVVTDFVNPTQFAPNEDLESYPRDFEKDRALAEKMGADLIFNPEPSEMYEDLKTYIVNEDMGKKLCGKTRPIHFRGVLTVVSKFFNIVQPDKAYFGKKDAQQLSIIRKMVKDLNFNIEIVGCDIVREKDGLAKSSRNTYLNERERKAALCLNKSLKLGKEFIEKKKNLKETVKTADLINLIEKEINKEELSKIDYIEVVNFENLTKKEVIDFKDKEEILVAIAVYIGKTRLIDNFIF